MKADEMGNFLYNLAIPFIIGIEVGKVLLVDELVVVIETVKIADGGLFGFDFFDEDGVLLILTLPFFEMGFVVE